MLYHHYNKVRTKYLFLFLIYLLTTTYSSYGQLEIDIGDITRKINSDVIPIHLSSEDKLVNNLMHRAFKLHGGYEITSEKKAYFFISIAKINEELVELKIESGRPKKVLLAKQFNGEKLRAAVLIACDYTVIKTLGHPGFFAGKLTFISETRGAKDIYLSDVLFSKPTQVTNDNAHCVGPVLSPDGKSLLYTSYYKNGFPNIYKINLSNGRRTNFVSYRGTNIGATYSHDGTMVAMALSGSGNSELYLSNPEGKIMSRLTRNNSIESKPSWSPDGKRLVFTSDKPGKPQLHLINSSGGKMKRIPTNISGYCAESDWNPINSNLIVFTILIKKNFALALYDFTTANSTIITKFSGDCVEPCWTNDGRHLIYTQKSAKNSRLILLDTKSGKMSNLHNVNFGNTSEVDFIYVR